jgi:competence protein ComEC
LLFGALGAMRYESSLPAAEDTLVSHYNERGQVQLEATVCEEPEQGGRYTRVLLDSINIRDGERSLSVRGRIQVTTADPRPLHYADQVRFTGSLQTPQPLGDFDYAAYLALSEVYSPALNPSMEGLSSERGRTLKRDCWRPTARWAMPWRGCCRSPVVTCPIASARQALGAVRVAINGLRTYRHRAPAGDIRTPPRHPLAAVVSVLLAALGRRHYLYVWRGLAALWTYALFTGMKPPVVRAAIMASVFLLAEAAGRQKHAPTALALAAAVMLYIEPTLLWRTSFQLSVLAMGGLILLFPPARFLLASWCELLTARLRMTQSDGGFATDIVAATLAATIAIWPVCAGTFGQVSVVGIPASLLTLPVLPFALGASSLAAVTALISTTLAAPFAWLAWLLLSYTTAVVEALSSLQWATLSPGAADQWLVAAWYALLCATPLWWRRVRTRPEERTPSPRQPVPESPGWLGYALPPLLLMATLTWAAVACAPDGRLHVVFLDVGQGDCVLVQSPNGRTALIDGGPDGRLACTLIDEHLPFWDRSIDVVVATHPHADHVGGLLSVVERYRLGLVLDSCSEGDSLLAEEWWRRASVLDTPVRCAAAGQVLSLGDGTLLEILGPSAMPLFGTGADIDKNGVGILVSYWEMAFLLGADVGAEAERQLVHRQPARLQSQVLKVPHHGSNTSSTAQFLAAVAPCAAVISVGADNAYGHPHDDVLQRLDERGVAVFTPRDSGTIEFVTDGHALWLRKSQPSEHHAT